MVPPRVPNPPARFAVSLIDPPTRAVGVATVVRVGVARLTTLVSPGSLQAVAIRGLLMSPLCVWCSGLFSAYLGVNGFEVAVPVPPPELTTALVLVKIAALPRVAAFGSERVSVVVPLRVPQPPTRFAVSLIAPPTGAVGVATVVRIGVAWLTTLVSPGSFQAVAVPSMLTSPLELSSLSLHDALPILNGFEVAVPVPPPELTTALVLVKIAALP